MNWSDSWHVQTLLGEISVMAWLGFAIYRRVSLIAGIAFFYFGAFGVYCQFRDSPFFSTTFNMQDVLNGNTARSVAFLLFVVLPFCFSYSTKRMLFLFKTFGALSAGYMLYNYWQTGVATGFIGMDSVDGAFLALLLPLLKINEMGVIFLAVLLSKGSAAYGILAVEIAAFLFLRLKKHKAFVFVGALTLASVSSYFMLGNQILNDNGRLNILGLTFKVFSDFSNWFFGMGTGTFISVMPDIQGRSTPYFVFLHSEPFQVLFEQGLLGLSLLVALYLTMLYKRRTHLRLCPVLLGTGFQSFIQPCFRYFVFAFFMSFLVALSFDDLVDYYLD